MSLKGPYPYPRQFTKQFTKQFPRAPEFPHSHYSHPPPHVIGGWRGGAHGVKGVGIMEMWEFGGAHVKCFVNYFVTVKGFRLDCAPWKLYSNWGGTPHISWGGGEAHGVGGWG